MCRLPLSEVRVPVGKPAGQGPRAQYDDEFLQYTYKVVPCDKTWRHDYATCPFAHAGESSERRHPSAYLPFMCGSTQHSTDLKEKCPFGTACKYAHGHFELWLHPGRFRTKMCSLGGNCRRPVCFFAHSEHELRVTPYSKLDTSASVAAQQLADMGQQLDANATCARSSTDGSELKGSLASSSSSEAGHSEPGKPGSSGSPCGSISVDDASALASLTAMGGLNPAANAMLDACGMAGLQGSAYLAAAAAAVDASLGSSDMPGPPALWPLGGGMGGAALLPQAQPLMYAAAYGQPQPLVLDAPLIGYSAAAPASAAVLAAAPASDVWLLPAAGAPAPQWPARAMLAPQQQQLAFSAGLAAAPRAGVQLSGLPVPQLASASGLDPWQDGSASSGSFPMQAALVRPQVGCGISQQAAPVAGNAQVVQQLLTNQAAVQQLLGMLSVDAQGAH